MSYEPTNWKAGDTVTSVKLNKLEQGVARAGVLVVGIDDETGALDKTWQEIHDAGFTVVKHDNVHGTIIGYVTMVGQGDGVYALEIWEDEDYITCITNSADGYPIAQAPGSNPNLDPTTPT